MVQADAVLAVVLYHTCVLTPVPTVAVGLGWDASGKATQVPERVSVTLETVGVPEPVVGSQATITIARLPVGLAPLAGVTAIVVPAVLEVALKDEPCEIDIGDYSLSIKENLVI